MAKDFEKVFHSHFQRKPSKDDLKKVVASLPSLVGPSNVEADFNSTIHEIREAASLNEEDVSDAIRTLAQADKKAQDEADARSEARSRTFRRAVTMIVLMAGLGAGVGAGVIVHGAFREPAVISIREAYEAKVVELAAKIAEQTTAAKKDLAAKTAELEAKFFGPLTTLLETPPACSLTTLERDLYFSNLFKKDFRENMLKDNVIFDKQLPGVRVTARSFSVPTQFNRFNEAIGHTSYLTIEKKDDKGLSSLYVYENKKQRNEHLVETQSMIPESILIFSGDQARYIFFPDPSPLMRVVQNNKTILEGQEGLEVYRKLANDTMKEFKTIYSRGPNDVKEAK